MFVSWAILVLQIRARQNHLIPGFFAVSVGTKQRYFRSICAVKTSSDEHVWTPQIYHGWNQTVFLSQHHLLPHLQSTTSFFSSFSVMTAHHPLSQAWNLGVIFNSSLSYSLIPNPIKCKPEKPLKSVLCPVILTTLVKAMFLFKWLP